MNDPKEVELAYIAIVYTVFAFLALAGLTSLVRLARDARRQRDEQPVERATWPKTELMKVEEDGVVYAVANPRFKGKRTLPANYRALFRP